MSQNKFRNFLIKVKEDFFSNLTPHKTTLTADKVSLLLYKYSNQEPLLIHQFLIKATGKHDISWDDLLGYFQEEIYAKDQVKKLLINPLSDTEIIESHCNGFQKLIQFVKQKQTNNIQTIKSVPIQIAGKDVFLVCMNKQIVFYDYNASEIIANAVFKYSKVEQKLYLKEEEKRLKRVFQFQKKEQEYLDKVQILNLDKDKSLKTKDGLQRLLTSNLKESVRGSQISSQKSNDRKLFKKMQNQFGVHRRKQKSNLLKIKNDDTRKIFDIFSQASLQNSIIVANTFKQSRQNFKKYIQLDKSVLQKQKKQVSFDYSSLNLHRNFKKELSQMKNTNFKLTKMRKSIDNGQLTYNRIKSSSTIQKEDEHTSFLWKSNKIDLLQKNANILQIVTSHMYQNYLLVSLFNRQIRLFSIKRKMTNFQYTTIFQKGFREVVTYVQMYQNKKNSQYRIVLGLQVNNKVSYQNKGKNANQADQNKSTNVIVYQLDSYKNIQRKSFDEIFDFSAKFHPVKQFGLALFGQKGNLCVIELNGAYQECQQRVDLNLVVNNPTTNYRICINLVVTHRNLINLYLCCAQGYVYLFDRLCKRIKYHIRVSPQPILDLQMIKESAEILALYSNGKIAILSANCLQKYYVYQSDHEIFVDSKFLSFDKNKFYLYNSRELYPFQIVFNQEKKFNNFKPIKILNNRQKLKNKASVKTNKEKQKVVKTIEGKGGKADFLAILYENGEISFMDNSLKYIGSYFYFNVSNIADIICNQDYQFIAILTEDNTIQVVNLYTQNILFHLSFPMRDAEKEKKPRSYTDSLKSSVFQRAKPTKYKNAQTVKFLQFLNSTNSGIFFAVITQSNMAYHYSQKGKQVSTVNIQKSCGEQIATDQLLYQQDELLFASGSSITFLRRKTYNKKMVINVSQNKLVKLRKSQQSSAEKLICVDQRIQVYSVDVRSRVVKLLYSFKGLANDSFSFNQDFLLIQLEQRIKLVHFEEEKAIEIKNNTQLYFYKILKDQLIRISKNSGKIMNFNFIKREFQDFFV